MANDTNTFHYVTLPNGWQVGRFAALDAVPGIVHMVTTKAALDTMLIRNDHRAAAGAIASAAGLKQVAYVQQVHGNVVRTLTGSSEDGQALYLGEADGIASSSPATGVLTRGADCPLILAADPLTGVVGSAHASRRGTVAQIALRLIQTMRELAGGASQGLEQRVIACICPSAGPCCYQVGTEVVQTAIDRIGPHAEGFFVRRDDEILFDLWAANRDQLLHAGLQAENIHTAGVCTMCRNDLFPSHRREADSAGRFAAVIGRLA